jgi:hypothetical protein
MKNGIYLLALLFMLSCEGEKTSTYFTPDKAIQYFKSVKEICDRDNGALWGKNLYGPLMFVDRNNRRIIATCPIKRVCLRGKMAFLPVSCQKNR